MGGNTKCATIVNGFLDFPHTVKLLTAINVFQSVYIRQDYIEIYENIKPCLNKPSYNILITGIPGIGKSMFAYYMMWKLIHDKVFTHQNYFFQKNKNQILFFKGN